MKSVLLLIIFIAFVIGLGYLFGATYNEPGIFVTAIIAATVGSFWSYFFADKLVLSQTGAREISRQQSPDIYNLVENLCKTAGLPIPKIYIIDDPSPNAFATGRNPKHAAIAYTTGILNLLDKTELEGVTAHELSHVGNRDTLYLMITITLAGVVSWIIDLGFRAGNRTSREDENRSGLAGLALMIVAGLLAGLISTLFRLAVSRQREFLADASGAYLTRYPKGLASALSKLQSVQIPSENANSTNASLFFVSPLNTDNKSVNQENKVSWIANLFATHPPLEERIKRLNDMDGVK